MAFLSSVRGNRVEALVNQIVSAEDPAEQIVMIANFNSYDKSNLSTPEQKSFDDSLELIQIIAQTAFEKLEGLEGAQRARGLASNASKSSTHTTVAQDKRRASSLIGRVCKTTKNYIFPGIKKVSNYLVTKNTIFFAAEVGSYLYSGWRGVLTTGCIFAGIRMGASYLKRRNHSSRPDITQRNRVLSQSFAASQRSSANSSAAPVRKPASLLGRVVDCTKNYFFPTIGKVVNVVGKTNSACIVAGVGSYFLFGLNGAIATGAIYAGIRFGLPYLIKDHPVQSSATIERHEVQSRGKPLSAAHGSDGVAVFEPAPTSVSAKDQLATPSNICPISKEIILEERKIVVNGHQYDWAYLLVDLLGRDQANAQRDIYGNQIALPDLNKLVSKVGITCNQFNSLCRQQDRITPFLALVKESKGEGSAQYKALEEPCAKALSRLS